MKKNHGISHYGIAAAFLLLAALTSSAAAQGNRNDAETVRYAIERTDEVIKAARDIVSDSRSGKARIALEHAVSLQERARNNSELSNYGIALSLTGEARKEAWHAVGLARADTRREENFDRISEETRERLVRLRSRITENGIRDQRIDRLVDESASLLDKARMNHQQLRGELALKLAENAGKMAMQAEQRFRRVKDLKDMCGHRLELMERLLERARIRVERSGEAAEQDKLQLAMRQMNRARDSFRSGGYEACRINLDNGEAILRSLVRNFSPAGPESARAMLEETRRLQQRAQEINEDDAGSAGDARIEQAGRLLDEAEKALERGRTQEGVTLIEKARTMLRRSVSAPDGETARQRIRMLEQAEEEARRSLENCRAEGARMLFERAVVRRENAARLYGEGRTERALAEARIAANLFERIREICAY